ncbi:MAG: histidine phosphatase family protein [Waddliaceae bacterium]
MAANRFVREFCRSHSDLGRKGGAAGLSARVLQQMHLRNNRTPVEKGYDYLINTCNARRCYQPVVSAYSDFRTSMPTPFPEIFDTILILDLLEKKQFDPITIETGLRYLSENQRDNNLFGFFEDSSLLPPDVDDTALAMVVLLKHRRVKMSMARQAADAIIKNVDEKGVIQTYFPPRDRRDRRVDPSVCANALRFIYQMGRGDECRTTENYLFSFLENLSPDEGTLYYSKETFFYFMWEALKASDSLKNRFENLFADRLTERFGTSSNPIDLACRVLVSFEMGIPKHKELECLQDLHQADGSWPVDVAYTGSRKNLYWGSQMVTTAFALRALDNKGERSFPIVPSGFKMASEKLRYTEQFSSLSLQHHVIMVTHSDTLASRLKNFYDPDPDSIQNALTEEGKKHAAEIGKKLKKELLDRKVAILYGGNVRTSQMASIFKKQFPAADSQSVSWLNEINCDGWLGRPVQKVLGEDISAQAMFNHSNCLERSERGESFLDLLNRVYSGLINLQNGQFKENTTIILCTSRVNLAALKVLQRKDVDHSSNGCIHWSTMARKIEPGTVFFLTNS